MSLQNQSQNYSGDGGVNTSSSGPFADHNSITVGTTTTDGYLTAIAGGRAEFLSPADVLKQVKLGTDRCSGGGFDPASYWVKPEHSYHPQHPHWGFSSDHVPSTTSTGSGAMAAAATTAGLIGIGGFGAGEPLQATTGYNTGLFVPSIPSVPVPSDGITVQHAERATQSGGGGGGGGSSDQGPFQCPHCARTFSRRQNLAMHVTWQHGDGSTSPSSSEQRSFRCEIEGCGKTFRRRNNLTQHSKLHHQSQTASLSQQPQQQQQQQPPPPTAPPFNATSKPATPSHFGCLDGIYTGRSLVSQQLPGGFTNVTFNYGGMPPAANHNSNPETVAAGTSSASNSSTNSVTTNITSNKNSNSNGGCNGEVNPNNSTGSGKRSGWNRHARRGASEVSPEDVASGAAATVYECPHCSRSFTKRQSLGLHITWSHNPDGKAERTFLCERPGCEKAFRRKSSLAQHLKFHEGLKTEICPTCGKGFVHRYELNRHRKYHPQDTSASSSDTNGGNPRHICSGCGQAFNRGAQLTIHRRTHPSCCPSTPPVIPSSNFNHHIEPDSLQAPRTEPSPISNVAIITPLPTTTATTTTTTTTTTTALPYQQVHPSSNLPSQATTATSFSPHFHHLQQKENSTSLQRSNQPLQAPPNMRNPPTGLLQHPYASLPTVPTGPPAGGFAFSMSSAHHNNHATQPMNHMAHESLIGNVAAALLDKALDKAVAVAGCLPPAQQQHLLQVSMIGALHGDSESPNVHSVSSERESPNHHSMDTLLSNASSESQSVNHSNNTSASEIQNTGTAALQHASNVVSQENSGYSPLEWQPNIDHRNLAAKSAEVVCIKVDPEVNAVTSKDNASSTDEKESFLRECRETVKEQKKAIWRRIMVRCRKQKQVFYRLKSRRSHNRNQQSCIARKEHCSTCGIQLSTKGMLILHLRWLHLDTRPWTCQKCNKKFVCSGAMLQHTIALHQQSSSAICPRCGCDRGETAAFTKHNKLCRMNRQYTLRTECSSKSKNILHRCRICSRSFHNLASLKKHKRLREGIKECPICKKKFHTCRGLEVHRKTAHELSAINGIVTQKRKIGIKGVKRDNRLSANGSAKTYESGNACGQQQEDSSSYTLAGLSR